MPIAVRNTVTPAVPISRSVLRSMLSIRIRPNTTAAMAETSMTGTMAMTESVDPNPSVVEKMVGAKKLMALTPENCCMTARPMPTMSTRRSQGVEKLSFLACWELSWLEEVRLACMDS